VEAWTAFGEQDSEPSTGTRANPIRGPVFTNYEEEVRDAPMRTLGGLLTKGIWTEA